MSIELLYEMIEKNDTKSNLLILPTAIFHKQYNLVRKLITDPLIDLSYFYKNNPIYFAIRFNDLEMVKLLSEFYPCTDDLLEGATYEILEYLLNEYDLNPNNSEVLYLCAQNGKIDKIKLLLQCGVSQENIICGISIAKERGYKEIVESLKTYLK